MGWCWIDDDTYPMDVIQRRAELDVSQWLDFKALRE
jgi:hypothetical protein